MFMTETHPQSHTEQRTEDRRQRTEDRRETVLGSVIFFIRSLSVSSVLCPLSSVLCLLFSLSSPAFAADEVIDSVMYKDPDVPTARAVKLFPPRLTSLWLKALERPDLDVK